MCCCFFQWKCVVIVSSEIILLGDGMVFSARRLSNQCDFCSEDVLSDLYSRYLWSSRLLVRSYVKCKVLYNVVYNRSNGVSNGSSLRIKPFRLLKENSVHVYQQSKYCWSSLKRHELKLTVFAFVFCIYAVRIYRAMKVRSIIFLRNTGIKKRCDNWQQQIFAHSLFQLSVAN